MATTRLLFICGSRKPGPGKQGPSAARELLRAVAAGADAAGSPYDWFDLRELDLPFFDGRPASEYGSTDLDRVTAALAASDVLVLSVPAYWGAPAGVVKNLLDLIGGPAYDAPPEQAPPLAGKVAALLVVGADDISAAGALGSLRLTLGSMGAWTAPRAVVVPNPRKLRDVGKLMATLKDFGGYAASLGAPV
jgi:NAD(P)H-dependent FMN reductase